MSATVQYDLSLLASAEAALQATTRLDREALVALRAAARAQRALPCSEELSCVLDELIVECSGELSELAWEDALCECAEGYHHYDDDGDPPLVGDIDLW